MPPKPFKPPRPAGASKPKSKSTTPKSKTNADGVAKKPRAPYGSVKKAREERGRERSGSAAPRISAASRLSFAGLPSLSDSGDELDRDSGKGMNGNGHKGGVGGSDSEPADNEEEEDVRSMSSDSPAPQRRNTAREERATGELNENRKEPAIPVDLLNVLLHQFYKHDNTKMAKDANAAVGKYMETFVREAVARVAYAKVQEGGGTMEVGDLEKVAVQLILDF